MLEIYGSYQIFITFLSFLFGQLITDNQLSCIKMLLLCSKTLESNLIFDTNNLGDNEGVSLFSGVCFSLHLIIPPSFKTVQVALSIF